MKAASQGAKAPDMAHRLRQARINAGYKTATQAVNEFNWAASKYRAHENGQNPFRVADAEKYGAAFQVSPAWLLTGSGSSAPLITGGSIFYVGKSPSSSNNAPTNIPLNGIICAGLWRDVVLLEDSSSQEEARLAPIDPRFPTEAQFDMVVRGNAISKIATDGSLVRCLDLRLFQQDIKHGDYVVVERLNEDGLQEISAKQYKINGAVVELHNATEDPRLKEQILIFNGERNSHKIQIIGKIIWAYKKLDE